MAVIKCPECGGNVSTEAAACPHCGFPVKNAGAGNTAGPVRTPSDTGAPRTAPAGAGKTQPRKASLWVKFVFCAMVVLAVLGLIQTINGSTSGSGSSSKSSIFKEVELPYGMTPGMNWNQAVQALEKQGLVSDSGIEDGMIFYNPNTVYGVKPDSSTLKFGANDRDIIFWHEFSEGSKYSFSYPSQNFIQIRTRLNTLYGNPIPTGDTYSYTWGSGPVTVSLYYQEKGLYWLMYIYEKK